MDRRCHVVETVSWRWFWVVVVVLGWVRKLGGHGPGLLMSTVHRWRLLLIGQRPGPLMNVIRQRCQNVWSSSSKKGRVRPYSDHHAEYLSL